MEAYSFPEQRHTSDLLIAFVQNLDGENSHSTDYRLHLGEAAVIISQEATFDIYEIAHAIGHVLGAGHTKDPLDPDYKPIVYYAQGYIEAQGGPNGDQSREWCTIMSPQPCLFQPLFSQPRGKYQNHRLGIPNANDNGDWIKQNRFVWKDVGDQSSRCEIGSWGNEMPYEYWIQRCFDRLDLTSVTSIGVFKCMRIMGRTKLIKGWVPFNKYSI